MLLTPAPALRLFLLGALSLYLELALIRFTAAEVIYLGYFSNFVLLSVFLGIGVGFLLSQKNVRLFPYTLVVLAGLLAFAVWARVDLTELREIAGPLFFGHSATMGRFPMWISLVILFFGSSLTFICIAQEMGKLFSKFKPIVAYSLDIGGSLTGIVLFTLHAYLGGTPAVWFAVCGLVMAWLEVGQGARLYLVIAGALVCVGLAQYAQPRNIELVAWSPYQRIDVRAIKKGYLLQVNRIGHQTMQPVGTKEPIYDFPYTEVLEQREGRKFNKALIIGAGSGSDTSYALHYGVASIDAVEIDPEILRAGRLLHPAKPYDNPKVRTFIDDGRAFMEHSSDRYDLIVFALPDSLASFSNLSNIRLESFLFTLESFQQARRLLNDDGVLVLYNYYRKPWLVDKLADMLHEVFGHPPMVQTYTDESGGQLSALAIGPQLVGNHHRTDLELATDDWPFLYMHDRGMPKFYLLVMLFFMTAGLMGILVGKNRGGLQVRQHGPFFLMGAAFLLLETKSVIQFSLLFGATWLVNSLVFFAILTSVLLANLIVTKLRLGTPLPLFAILLGSLTISLTVSFSSLLQIEQLGIRYLTASLILFSPIFAANLVFGFLFKDTPHSAIAFGWNLLGAMVGGALEYTSLALGYQTLGYIVVALYLTTIVWVWRVNPAGCTHGCPS